jgi:hypothetical protein
MNTQRKAMLAVVALGGVALIADRLFLSGGSGPRAAEAAAGARAGDGGPAAPARPSAPQPAQSSTTSLSARIGELGAQPVDPARADAFAGGQQAPAQAGQASALREDPAELARQLRLTSVMRASSPMATINGKLFGTPSRVAKGPEFIRVGEQRMTLEVEEVSEPTLDQPGTATVLVNGKTRLTLRIERAGARGSD